VFSSDLVRIFTSDRRNRWSYDSESSLSYRHETTSEESFFAAGMARAMSDLDISESGSASSSYDESWAEGGGGASLNLGIIKIGGGGGGGSYDADSASSFTHSLSRHAESSSAYVAASVRAKSATAIGEVESRQHAEGESEAHYESASRMFSNPNKCSAITYIFHNINKTQHVRFKLVAIERRVDDSAAPTGAYQRPPVDVAGKVMVIPKAISATSKDRLATEQMARVSVAEKQKANVSFSTFTNAAAFSGAALSHNLVLAQRDPISIELREAALKAVDEDLVKGGLLDEKTKLLSAKIIAELSWEREEIIPTPGVIVKGCLDDCPTCEPALVKDIGLDLERKKLENDLLRQRIALLDKAQEYRCCPIDSVEDECGFTDSE